MSSFENLTIKETHKHFSSGDFSPEDLVNYYLGVIDKKDKDIQAYLEVFGDAQAEAKKLNTKDIKEKPLLGIPFAVKDNILIEGKKVSAASKILEGYTAPYDATAIRKLKEAGAIFIGRTNCDEFAMGASTENSSFQKTKNPHDITRVPGGSSGGSAAAIAMDGALASLGSDTGGSIRQPAALCGVVGLKPTYGSVSRNGLIALGSSLDVIGPITRTVSDAESIFDVISGKDPLDSTSIEKREEVDAKKPKTIGVPRALVEHEKVSNEVKENFEMSLKKLKELGYDVVDTELPYVEYAVPVYYVLLPAEASANLARFDGVRFGFHKEGESGIDDFFKTRGEGFGKEVRRRIILGTYVLSAGYYDAYYHKALLVRSQIKKSFKKVFDGGIDVIATPTSTSHAFLLGEKVNDPVSMYLEDLFTVSANIVGSPAISVPSGFVSVGDKQLPLGIQFIAPHFHENSLFTIGKTFLGEDV